MSGRETFDVTAKEKRILEFRASRRNKLRHEYLKQIGNPYRHATGEGGSVFDLGLMRYQAMKAKSFDFFRPNPKNAIFNILAIVVPTGLAMWWIVGTKDAQEAKLRRGEVSYRDRPFKFV